MDYKILLSLPLFIIIFIGSYIYINKDIPQHSGLLGYAQFNPKTLEPPKSMIRLPAPPLRPQPKFQEPSYPKFSQRDSDYFSKPDFSDVEKPDSNTAKKEKDLKKPSDSSKKLPPPKEMTEQEMKELEKFYEELFGDTDLFNDED